LIIALIQPTAGRFQVHVAIKSEALRPVLGVTVSLVERDFHDYYDLAAPIATLVIGPPTLSGVTIGSGVARLVIYPLI
jgi:hypothetical protein